MKNGFQEHAEAHERRLLESCLKNLRGNTNAIAKLLACNRVTVYRKIRRYGFIGLQKKMRKAA